MAIHKLDALIVGAGVGGIYHCYRLRELGLDFKCIDTAPELGGTWYWNKYPGAMSDTESYLYRYSWDLEDLRTYPWTNRYLYQPEILKYLNHVVDRHDLRGYFQLNTEMEAAEWDDSAKVWRVSCSTGDVFHVRYLVNSLGLLSKINFPQIEGLHDFKGVLTHTASWDTKLDLTGKRVGVIGNGSTGVQVMTALAPIVKHLTSFQRHPQYSVPSGQGSVSPEEREALNKDYVKIWDGVWNSAIGFGVPEVATKTMSVSAEERQQIFQRQWDKGNGFGFMFSAFGDLTIDEEANEEVCKFIRSKIDEIVKDKRKAEILKPRDFYARRPLCDSGYYQIFNGENVDVVDLKSTPIERIVPDGIKTADGTIHQLDVLIFATGFDAIDGNYTRIKIKGRGGKTVKEHWQDGATAYLGIACHGFPNMFLTAGPQGPFANFPPIIESEVNLISSCIAFAEQRRKKDKGVGTVTMEASAEAEKGWVELCDRMSEGSLFRKTPSWIFGVNIPGRKPVTKFFFAGLKAYLDHTAQVMKEDFRGFVLETGP